MPPEFAIMPARPALRARASYEGGAQTRRTLGWNAPTASPNSAIMGSLSLLRARSRQASRNDGYAKSILDKLTTNMIGTGIKPLSQSADPIFRESFHQLFLRWTDESDADGILDFYGQQTQVAHAWLEAGEVFVRFRDRLPTDGMSVPLQLQVIEPELCPYTQNSPTQDTPKNHKVRAGIEFNLIGRKTAFYFHPVRPGDLEDYDASTLVRVPADHVCHIYDPLRPGQLRGLPLLTPTLVRLWHMDKMDDSVLLRQELSNMVVGFLKRAPTTELPQLDPLTNGPLQTLNDQAMIALEPGTFQEIADGEEVSWSEPPDPSQSYPDFMKLQLRHACTAAGVPYEVVTGDLGSVNDRTVRVLLHEFRRRIQAWQHQIIGFQFCRRVCTAWFDRAFLSGALDIPLRYLQTPEQWNQVKWMPQAWPYLHPVQDVEAMKDAVRCGFKDRGSIVAETGEDVEAIDQNQANDNARADKLGLKHDSDGRNLETASIDLDEVAYAAAQGANA